METGRRRRRSIWRCAAKVALLSSMKVSGIEKVLLLGAALGAAGCSMPAAPGGPDGLSSKTVTTVAGTAGAMGSANGTGVNASFWFPAGMAYVAPYIYIADSGNSTIRRLDPSTGAVTLFAGYPGVAGYFDNAANPTLYAYFNHPEGIATDGNYLYVADSGNNVIRRVNLTSTPAGLVDTLAGNPTSSGFVDGTGQGAFFSNPLGICYDSGNTSLYVADTGNSSIRRVTNLTGPANAGAVASLCGAPTSTTFYWPYDVVLASSDLYVADAGYDVVFQVTTGGIVNTLAGSGSKGDVDGTGTAAQFDWPEGITTDGSGNLYVADTLSSVVRRVVIGTAAVTTFAGQGQVFGSQDGPGNVALFNHPMRLLWISPDLYVADAYNQTIRVVK
jgi:sugar lactone lactonase YvrE